MNCPLFFQNNHYKGHLGLAVLTTFIQSSQAVTINTHLEKYSANYLRILIFRIHQPDKPLFEMDDVHGYEKVRELIELEFPYLDDDGIGKVYSSVLECMNFKDHVRQFFFQKNLHNFLSCSLCKKDY